MKMELSQRMEKTGLKDVEMEVEKLLPRSDESSNDNTKTNENPSAAGRKGFAVLCLLAFQNCSKNLLMRYVMKDHPKFLTSAAVLLSECIKMSLSVAYILFIQRQSARRILDYMWLDRRNTLLIAVPASAYNFQMSMEYVALANLNAATFAVLVQTKLLSTASFAALVLRKKLKFVQVLSLLLLTVGVMLCSYPSPEQRAQESAASDVENKKRMVGILATLAIAFSSGLASVYTEKVIKAAPQEKNKEFSTFRKQDYGLAYSQVQLAAMSLVTMGLYAIVTDWTTIMKYGLFHNFTKSALASVFMSALGGLTVAAVLKYADSVLKGYATAVSVILTGCLSMLFFGTQLSAIYFMGIVNVVTSVVLYNGKNLDRFICGDSKAVPENKN